MLWMVLVLLCLGLGLVYRHYGGTPRVATAGFCFGDNKERRDHALSLLFPATASEPYVSRISMFVDAVKVPRGRDAGFLGNYARLLQSRGADHFIDTQRQLYAEEFSVSELESLAEVIQEVPDLPARQLRVHARLEAETRRYATYLWNELKEPPATPAAARPKRRVFAA